MGLTEKAKQSEAEWRERERLVAKAKVKRLAKEERVAEERHWKEERVAEERHWKEEEETERAAEAENRRHTEEVARKVAEGLKGKGKAKLRPCLVSKAVSTFIFRCSDCLISSGSVGGRRLRLL